MLTGKCRLFHQFNWLQERPFDSEHTLYKKSLPIELVDEVG